MAFLTIYTPTYKRPKALKVCKDSVKAQKNAKSLIQHVIIPDNIGIGIDGLYRDIPNHIDKVKGDYVLMLSDDDMLINDELVKKFYDLAIDGYPEVVIFKAEKEGRHLPSLWRTAPQFGHIDLSNFIVRSDIWKANADKWGQRYEGDFDFIRSLWDQGHQFTWWDFVGVKAQRISRGQPE